MPCFAPERHKGPWSIADFFPRLPILSWGAARAAGLTILRVRRAGSGALPARGYHRPVRARIRDTVPRPTDSPSTKVPVAKRRISSAWPSGDLPSMHPHKRLPAAVTPTSASVQKSENSRFFLTGRQTGAPAGLFQQTSSENEPSVFVAGNQCDCFAAGDKVPLVVDGRIAVEIPVAAILPLARMRHRLVTVSTASIPGQCVSLHACRTRASSRPFFTSMPL